MSNEALPLYKIVDYNDLFENFRSRQLQRCNFLYAPNKLGGAGLANVLGEPDGGCIYGIWNLIIRLCSGHPKPREGYLTANGQKDGRRYPIAELARLFRRPAHEITRCLQVVSSPEVGWMVLLDGCADASQALPERYANDDRTLLDGCADASQALPERYANDAQGCYSTDDERKKERKKSLSKGGESEDSDPIQHAEAKRLLGKLSEHISGVELRENQWAYDLERILDEQLPLKRSEWELIHWFYTLPDDHEVLQMTSRRQSLASLIENLPREVEKIRSVRKRAGLNGLSEKNAPTLPEAWTEKRRAAFKKLFPGTGDNIGPFHLLERAMRDQIDKAAKEI